MISTSKYIKQNDIGNFVKKVDFDDIIKTINKKITSNKTKYVRTY